MNSSSINERCSATHYRSPGLAEFFTRGFCVPLLFRLLSACGPVWWVVARSTDIGYAYGDVCCLPDEIAIYFFSFETPDVASA
jgi:hypothetical protein